MFYENFQQAPLSLFRGVHPPPSQEIQTEMCMATNEQLKVDWDVEFWESWIPLDLKGHCHAWNIIFYEIGL